MNIREDVPPDTVGVELSEDGVTVQYLDGREAFYHGVPQRREETVTTAPGKQAHVLLTDESETEGILVYVNDRVTHEDILESTGVGRVLLDPGERTTIFPGVHVESTAHRIRVEVDFDAIDGRAFVFEEDEMGERSFEVLPPEA